MSHNNTCGVHNCQSTAVATCSRCGIRVCSLHKMTANIPYSITVCPACQKKEMQNRGTKSISA